MGVKIRSVSQLVINCDRCNTDLAVINGGRETYWHAELDMGSETVRDLALHGLVCGKPAHEVLALRDALRAVKDAVSTGGAA